MWFAIKQRHSIAHGSKHLFAMIDKTRNLAERSKKIIFPVLQRNGYFSHPENILISLINDDNINMRKLGWRKILKARKTLVRSSTLRAFTIPKINFDAKTYYELIDWNDFYSEPPLAMEIPTDELEMYVGTGYYPMLPEISLASCSVNNIPCHSQAVERHVQLVSKSASRVVGEINRDGLIRATLQSRERMPSFATKTKYKFF